MTPGPDITFFRLLTPHRISCLSKIILWWESPSMNNDRGCLLYKQRSILWVDVLLACQGTGPTSVPWQMHLRSRVWKVDVRKSDASFGEINVNDTFFIFLQFQCPGVFVNESWNSSEAQRVFRRLGMRGYFFFFSWCIKLKQHHVFQLNLVSPTWTPYLSDKLSP